MTNIGNYKAGVQTVVDKVRSSCRWIIPTLILSWGAIQVGAVSPSAYAASDLSAVEQNCFDDFHRYGGSEWRRAVQGQAADGPVDDIDLNKCKPFVSKDMKTWIGSEPDSGASVSSESVAQKAEPGISTEGMSEIEAECFEAFYRNNGRYWLATVVGAGDTDFDVIPCLPFVSKDMKTWIGSEPDSGESVGSEPVNFVLNIIPNPSDGKVFLNGVYEGLGAVKLDLAQGNYLVEVIKDGFEPFEKAVELNKSIILEVAMNPIRAPTPELQQGVASNAEVVFWQTIKDSDDPAMFQEYLRQFPEGTGLFARLAKLRLEALGSKTAATTTSIPSLDYGSYHALVIGNNDYQHLPDLRTAVTDARRISDILEQLYGFEVHRLENANRRQILRLVSKLRQEISDKDNLLIYYAGHGHLDEAAGEGYWLPVDADPEDPSNWLMTDQIVGQIRAMSAKHVLIVSDSCFSGVLTRGIKIAEKTPSYIARMTKSKARLALTSGGLEPVADSGGSGHSVFAASFISLLEANQGVLDGTQLFSDLRPRVMVNSEQTPEYGRIRKAGDGGGDFLFVRH